MDNHTYTEAQILHEDNPTLLNYTIYFRSNAPMDHRGVVLIVPWGYETSDEMIKDYYDKNVRFTTHAYLNGIRCLNVDFEQVPEYPIRIMAILIQPNDLQMDGGDPCPINLLFTRKLFEFTPNDWEAKLKGKSAFEIARDFGFTGTEQEWLETLKGKDGKDGHTGNNYYLNIPQIWHNGRCVRPCREGSAEKL